MEDVRIRLSHHRNDPSGEAGLERLDTIDGAIQLEGDLDATQRQRLLEIAGRCWMHRTLSAGVTIRFHLQKERHAGSHRQTTAEITRLDGVSN